jgi:hypothetical protein
MPENFYKRVMDMEKEIERHRENSDEATIRTLIQLYSDAIEYHACFDQMDRC